MTDVEARLRASFDATHDALRSAPPLPHCSHDGAPRAGRPAALAVAASAVAVVAVASVAAVIGGLADRDPDAGPDSNRTASGISATLDLPAGWTTTGNPDGTACVGSPARPCALTLRTAAPGGPTGGMAEPETLASQCDRPGDALITATRGQGGNSAVTRYDVSCDGTRPVGSAWVTADRSAALVAPAPVEDPLDQIGFSLRSTATDGAAPDGPPGASAQPVPAPDS